MLLSRIRLLLGMHVLSTIFFVISLSSECRSDDATKAKGALVVVDSDDIEDDVVVEETFVTDTEEFIPTNKWKSVKPGQAIPAGLNIRLNLETGEREAKLLDEVEQVRSEKSDELEISRQRIQAALENFSEDMDDVMDEKLKQEATKTTLRSYEELKQQMNEMKVEIKTDWETMRDLMIKYNQSGITLDEKLLIWEDMEYYLHQVDNAADFCQHGGLGWIRSTLNSSEPRLQSAAALALAAATQGNTKVQIAVIEGGLGPQVIHLISTSPDLKVRSRCLAVISALTRHFPWAQREFIKWGGLSALSSLFQVKEIDDKVIDIQSKVISFLAHMYHERVEIEKMTVDDELHEERLQQYRSIDLGYLLGDGDWCQKLVDLLPIPRDHFIRERVLKAATIFGDICRYNLHSVAGTLVKLRQEYNKLAEAELSEEGQQGYFHELRSYVNALEMSLAKDEL